MSINRYNTAPTAMTSPIVRYTGDYFAPPPVPGATVFGRPNPLYQARLALFGGTDAELRLRRQEYGRQLNRMQPELNRVAQRVMEGAAFSGGLAGAGELAGHAIGQSVLNRAFSVAGGGGVLARPALQVARRMALGPGEVAAGYLGNVGQLAGTGLALSQSNQNVENVQAQRQFQQRAALDRHSAVQRVQTQVKRTVASYMKTVTPPRALVRRE